MAYDQSSSQYDADIATQQTWADKMSSGYQWVDKGTGVDYFFNGTPITREVFAAGTGQDVGAVEAFAAKYGGTAQAEETGVGGGGGGSIGKTMAQISAANTAYQAQLKQIETAKASGLLDVEDAQALINENRLQLKKDLQGGYEGNQSYFSQVSPDAYQSQIQNYDTKVLDAYNTSNTALDRNQNRIADARAAVEAKAAADAANATASYQDYVAPSSTGGGSLAYTAAPTTYSQGMKQTATEGSDVGGSMKVSASGQAGGGFWNGLVNSPIGKAISAYNATGAKSINDVVSGAKAIVGYIDK